MSDIGTLSSFKAPVAVVDWVALVVELQRNSNGGYIKGAYQHFGVSHADPLDKGAGSAASKFVIRLQHPASYSVIERLLSDLDAKYGLASVPTLSALEVSIDFYHRHADIAALQAMTERLMVSVVPPVIESPRICGDRFDPANITLPARGRGIDAEKTLYIGHEGSDLMWRVYWKRTDDTFVGEDGKRVPMPLPPAEFRVRVEVRIQGAALKALNLLSVSDLRDFSYERLHTAGLFKFAMRNKASGPIFPNRYAMNGAKSLGIDDDSPACVLNRFGRRDRRGRVRQLSRHLTTDTELTEATRLALRRLTLRFL